MRLNGVLDMPALPHFIITLNDAPLAGMANILVGFATNLFQNRSRNGNDGSLARILAIQKN